MARNSRLMVCLAMLTRNSSHIHWHRSTSRQRTTPWIAVVGPLSIIVANAAPVRVAQPRRPAGRLAVDQAIGPLVVELHHPVANDLQGHPADLGRLGPRPAVVDRGQGKKPARLRRILRSLRRRSHQQRRNQPGAGSAWRNSIVRHLELRLNRFANPHPKVKCLQRLGIKRALANAGSRRRRRTASRACRCARSR